VPDATFTILDHDEESSVFSVHTGAVTAVSLPGLLTQFGDFREATEALTLGTFKSESLDVFNTLLSNTPPADANAQRERKWIIYYEDATQFFDAPVNAIPNAGYRKPFHFEIPTADIEGQILPNTAIADVTTAEWVAWIAAFEAMARSPYGGAVNFLSAEVVGRNL
jgi:hypothetical protein